METKKVKLATVLFSISGVGKGGVRGERNHHTKLKEQQVRQIKTELRAGVQRYVLAEKYGVSREAIKAIDIGKSWRWVEV